MRVIKTPSYLSKVAQTLPSSSGPKGAPWYVSSQENQRTPMRRYQGSIDLKIFVPWDDDEKASYKQAEEIIFAAEKAMREAGIQADASFGSLNEVPRF